MTFLLDFCIFAAGWAIGVFAHEGGHWLVGSLLRIQIYLVSVGIGQVWFRGRVGAVAIELHALPAKGIVFYHPPLRTGRLASALFFLSGVLANVAILVSIALATSGPSIPLVDRIAPGFTWAQLYLVAWALIPYPGPHGGSDGYQTIRALFGKRDPAVALADDRYAQVLRPYQSPGVDASSGSPGSAEIRRQWTRLEQPGERADAAAALLVLLDRGEARRDETLLALDALITKHLLYGDFGLSQRLDELSARALELGPEIATLRGSRGACLVELGRYAEGSALLTPLAAGEPSFDSILSQLYLARAEHARGCPAQALRLLEVARAGVRACPSDEASLVLARTETEIGART